MTSHELARQLLENPELPVVVLQPGGKCVEIRPSNPQYGVTVEYIVKGGYETGKVVRLMWAACAARCPGGTVLNILDRSHHRMDGQADNGRTNRAHLYSAWKCNAVTGRTFGMHERQGYISGL